MYGHVATHSNRLPALSLCRGNNLSLPRSYLAQAPSVGETVTEIVIARRRHPWRNRLRYETNISCLPANPVLNPCNTSLLVLLIATTVHVPGETERHFSSNREIFSIFRKVGRNRVKRFVDFEVWCRGKEDKLHLERERFGRKTGMERWLVSFCMPSATRELN